MGRGVKTENSCFITLCGIECRHWCVEHFQPKKKCLSLSHDKVWSLMPVLELCAGFSGVTVADCSLHETTRCTYRLRLAWRATISSFKCTELRATTWLTRVLACLGSRLRWDETSETSELEHLERGAISFGARMKSVWRVRGELCVTPSQTPSPHRPYVNMHNVFRPLKKHAASVEDSWRAPARQTPWIVSTLEGSFLPARVCFSSSFYFNF